MIKRVTYVYKTTNDTLYVWVCVLTWSFFNKRKPAGSWEIRLAIEEKFHEKQSDWFSESNHGFKKGDANFHPHRCSISREHHFVDVIRSFLQASAFGWSVKRGCWRSIARMPAEINGARPSPHHHTYQYNDRQHQTDGQETWNHSTY